MRTQKRQPELGRSAFSYRVSLLLLAAIFYVLPTHAQQNRMKRANTLYERGQLSASIRLYHKVLDQADIPQAKIRLAEAYRRIGDYHTAAQWYALVMGLEESQPEHRLQYGFCLLRTGDCEAAERWFQEYLSMRPYDSRKPDLANACATIQRLGEDNPGVSLRNLNINTSGQDLAPAFFRNGLVYTSTNRPEGADRAYAGLFFAPKLEGDSIVFGAASSFSGSLDQPFHEGVAAFNSSQNEIFFTRTRQTERQEGRLRLEITAARLLPQGNWSALKPLPFSSDDYSVAHPSISKDGQRLYFSSDMPGGQGGKDIYVSVRVNGNWSEPLNLGKTINTEGDEVFPYIALDGSLYFSSDGLVGLGGQDLYRVCEDEAGLWGRPENLGAPFNTKADDFAIIVDSTGTMGYFTSNREGGKGADDLYYFEKTGRPVQLEVLALDGGQPLEATLLLKERYDTVATNANGQAILQLQTCTYVTAKSPGYKPKTIEVCPQEMDKQADTLVVAIALEAQSFFNLAGVAFDQVTGQPLPGVQLQLFSDSCATPQSDYTNAKGQFQFETSTPCCYTLQAALDGYQEQTLEDTMCLNAERPRRFTNVFLEPEKEAADALPISDAPSEQDIFTGFERSDHSASDTSELIYRLNVYYDVGRSSVQPNSIPELIKLRDLLLRNQDLHVAIYSHTDSEGGYTSNMRLSQKRADKIMRYLIGQGVERDRLEAQGFGETRLVNDCEDGVPCEEWEHQENRRTEFKVLD
ncbi:MAG: OmpA family protein [Bacteroidetes bacterium]|jgi:outer membrane protein OmpA-like peptidoglycan-associated protein/tetratricopeptide (TPR) repeat protein|nr:OmpA family protein [Bacteroidota bacterium]